MYSPPRHKCQPPSTLRPVGTDRTARPVDEVAKISDPAERARTATQLLGEHQSAVTELAKIRRLAVAELRDQGLSYAQVGNALGITRGRIAQLRGPDATAEAAFFGGRRITIATPLRQAAGGRSMVAQEDADAAAVLTARLTAVDLEVSTERIAPDGPLNLAPDALVLICGPKTSKFVGDMIQSDPAFDFSEREGGRWTIIDRDSGDEFASPLSSDPDATEDFAYLARLDRGDGRPVVLIAGIHAIGSLGVATLVAEPKSLQVLERETGGRPFSTVVRSVVDTATLTIEEAALATPVRLHQPI